MIPKTKPEPEDVQLNQVFVFNYKDIQLQKEICEKHPKASIKVIPLKQKTNGIEMSQLRARLSGIVTSSEGSASVPVCIY